MNHMLAFSGLDLFIFAFQKRFWKNLIFFFALN